MIHQSLLYRNGAPEGTIASLAQYKINPCQALAVAAIDSPAELVSITDEKRLIWQYLTWYQDLNWILRMQLYELLEVDGWDFINCPNPAVFYSNLSDQG